jgi:hypothetical protein
MRPCPSSTRPVARGPGSSPRARVPPVAAGALALALLAPSSAKAATLTPKDVQVLGKVFAFLDPAVAADGVIAVAYVGGDETSRADAEAIAGYFGDGLRVGGATLRAKPVDVASLGDGSGFVAIVAAKGASGEAVMAVAMSHKILCASGELDQVEAARCIMAIHSDPKVEISVNRGAASAADIGFAAAFRMMIREF